MGEDSSGLAYHWFDLHLSPEGEPQETIIALRDARSKCPGVQLASVPVYASRQGQAVKGASWDAWPV